MNELEAVKQAILGEEEGAAFYDLAAQNSSRPEAKEAFVDLKNEELKHARWLRSLYKKLQFSSSISDLEWASVVEVEADRLSLNKKTKNVHFTRADTAFKLATTDLAVYAAGILMEKDAVAFYQQAAADATSPEAKKLFTTLAEWEKTHVEDLSETHAAMKEIWLEEQGFMDSPAL